MKQINYVFLSVIFIFLFSCKKEEINISILKKANIVFDNTFKDINSVPQRIIANNKNDFFLYGWEYIVKVDEVGNKKWVMNYNNNALAPTKDGGCIIAYSKGSNAYEKTYYLTKINSDGNIVWEKSGGNYQLSQIVIGDNDEIYGVGDIEKSYSVNKPKLFRYSKDGDYQFSKFLINSNDKITYQTLCITKLTNNRIVIGTLNSVTEDRENYDFNIIEFDLDASNVLEKHYGGYRNDYIRNIFETLDGGLILVGGSQSKDGDVKSFRNELSFNDNGWLVKLDNNRIIEWEKIIGGTDGGTFLYKATFFDNKFIVGFKTEATDIDFKVTDRPKSGYLEFDTAGNILEIKYIGVWSVDCEFNSKGELHILSSKGDEYYETYNPRIIKIK